MPRGKSSFRISDVARAIKAAVRGGLVVAQLEIEPDGKIVLIAANDNVAEQRNGERNEWDDVDDAV
jgi:hypothetical protein